MITDSGGDVLREVTRGRVRTRTRRHLECRRGLRAQLAGGNAAFALPVTEVAPVITTLFRRIEVNLSEQRTYLFENEQRRRSPGTSRRARTASTPARADFRIRAKLATQNMGNPDLTKAPNYYTENVPWVMYYNGDEALHGAYWHNNFGNQMSHGCINMPVDAAEFVYAWAPMGTEVWVHY